MQAGAPVSSLRVLTINTHKGFTAFNRKFMLHELREAIRSVSADLVFLQEVQGEHEGHRPKWALWPEMPHYEFLADTIWPQYAYGRNAVYPHGHHGNAVLSKYPILHSENRDVSISGPEPRGLLYCVLQVPGLPQGLHAICVHLGLLGSHREKQLELLCHLVRNEVPPNAPLLVAGDFNDWRRKAHRVLQKCAGLTEVFQGFHGRSPRTFPARLPLLALDRIYVRNASVQRPVTLPRRPWSHLSDHVPLAAELRILESGVPA
jgi:endonuclease/exonuclease/phosphatase family metal-dependent hydrolase